MGTLGALLRTNALKAMAGQTIDGGEIAHVGLDTNYPTLNDMHAEIFFQTANNGNLPQDGTVTFVINVDHSETVEIYGFKFYEDGNHIPLGGGSFQETVTLEVGNEYTINVSGIEIDLPE